jgi:hypothetical protein
MLAVKLHLYRLQIKLINVTSVIKHFNSNLVKFGIGLHFGMLFTKKFNKFNRKIDTLNRPAGLGKLFAKHFSGFDSTSSFNLSDDVFKGKKYFPHTMRKTGPWRSKRIFSAKVDFCRF